MSKKNPPLSFWKNLLHYAPFNYSDSRGMTTGGYQIIYFLFAVISAPLNHQPLLQEMGFSNQTNYFPKFEQPIS